MRILVDTSVWIDHLRRGNPRLQSLLVGEQVLTHPFVIGELACGSIGNRDEILTLLQALPRSLAAEDDEVLRLIENEWLHGRGIGWTDAHLIASALLSRVALWTLDRKLSKIAATLGIPAS